MTYARISSGANGGVTQGVVFCTYSALIGVSSSGGHFRSRLKQLLQWCGTDFDGVIIFDECHRAKNLVPAGRARATKTGLAVLQLQTELPHARIVYVSATGASEPKNMAYMVRLGLWGLATPFRGESLNLTKENQTAVDSSGLRVRFLSFKYVSCSRASQELQYDPYGRTRLNRVQGFPGGRGESRGGRHGDRGHGDETPRHVHRSSVVLQRRLFSYRTGGSTTVKH